MEPATHEDALVPVTESTGEPEVANESAVEPEAIEQAATTKIGESVAEASAELVEQFTMEVVGEPIADDVMETSENEAKSDDEEDVVAQTPSPIKKSDSSSQAPADVLADNQVDNVSVLYNYRKYSNKPPGIYYKCWPLDRGLIGIRDLLYRFSSNVNGYIILVGVFCFSFGDTHILTLEHLRGGGIHPTFFIFNITFCQHAEGTPPI